MPKLNPIQQLDRISDEVKLITWTCQHCGTTVAHFNQAFDRPLCDDCKEEKLAQDRFGHRRGR